MIKRVLVEVMQLFGRREVSLDIQMLQDLRTGLLREEVALTKSQDPFMMLLLFSHMT